MSMTELFPKSKTEINDILCRFEINNISVLPIKIISDIYEKIAYYTNLKILKLNFISKEIEKQKHIANYTEFNKVKSTDTISHIPLLVNMSKSAIYLQLKYAQIKSDDLKVFSESKIAYSLKILDLTGC